MKKGDSKKFVTNVLVVIGTITLVGCGSVSEETASTDGQIKIEESISEASVALAAKAEVKEEKNTEISFKRGVYANYAKDTENPSKEYFYVFSDDNYGYTDDAKSGLGVPFDCKQDEGIVSFTFGGSDPKEEKLHITSADNGFIYGYFEGAEDKGLVFELVSDADPIGFNAQNYLSNGEYVYNDANGWSIKYDPERFTISQDGSKVAIVYTGESAGTNMILVTYDVEHSGKEMRDEIAKGYGDNVTKSDGIFPGTEDVEGYWAFSSPAEGGSGLCMSSSSRDYMGGSLTFECTEHISGNEALDMEVSDYMSMIIDSLTFQTN